MRLTMFRIIGTRRSAWWVLGLFANFLWALGDPARHYLHDWIAGARVVSRIRRRDSMKSHQRRSERNVKRA